MRVLQITNWYPSDLSKRKALFIKKHIDALSLYADNLIWHLEIIKGKFSVNKGINEDGSHYFIVSLPFEVWRINEWLSFWLVLFVLLKEGPNNFDIINFHIAYPNATYLHLLKKFIRTPIIITEHWSAYHFAFNVSNDKKLVRIKRIFKQNLPVIAVSNALINDIKVFSGADFPSYVVPNVVNNQIFQYKPEICSKSIIQGSNARFFMVSQWKWPKDPFTIINAWPAIVSDFPNAILRIGGYGPQWEEMKKLVKKLNIESNVIFLGYLNAEAIAVEMNKAIAFIHCSEYETFSVVCAEAVCCGTPVVASRIGGIREFINASNGIFFKRDNFGFILINNYKKLLKFNRKSMAYKAGRQFNEKTVGKLYYKSLKNILK